MAIDITTISVEMDTSSLRAGQTQLDRTAAAGAGLARSFAGVAAALGAGLGVTELARKLVDTERVTGSLMASLETATGSADNAKRAFESLAQLGTQLPESLNDVTKAFTMMVNRGLDPSQAAIKSYSNTASAMNKSLMQMVEAVADAATGQYVRLEEFGIKASKQGDKVALTFRGTTKTVQNNADAITGYLKEIGENEFAGMAEKKMATLDGAISNLGDSWDGLFRSINAAGTGDIMGDVVRGITSAIDSVTSAFKNGTVNGFLDAMAIKFGWVKDVFVEGFLTIVDAAKGAFGLVHMMQDKFLSYFGSSADELAGFYIDAFKSIPENIKAMIQIVVVEFAVLVDKAIAAGKYIKDAFTTGVDAGKNYAAEMERINGIRDQSISDILAEKDATKAAAEEAQKKAVIEANARKVEAEDLSKYKVQAGKAEKIAKEQQKAIGEAAKAEASRAKNIADMVTSMTRETDLMGEQTKEAQVRYDIEKGILQVKGGINGAEAQSLINAAAAYDLKKNEIKAAEEFHDKLVASMGDLPKIEFADDLKDQAEDISKTLTDALMRGFESGKGFAQNLKDTVKNMFKTLVIQPIIKPLMDKAAGAMSSIIGSSGTKGADGKTTGGAGMLGMLGPYGAMIGAAAAIGGALISKFNSSQEAKFEKMTAEYRQGVQGTGTLLGMANAKSDSINKALSEMGDNGASLLDVNHGMYQALLDIKTGIAGSAAGFARQSLGGKADAGIVTGTETLGRRMGLISSASAFDFRKGLPGLGEFGEMIGGFMNGISESISKALYSKKTNIIDSGVQIIGSSLAEMLEKGTLGAMNYAEVKTTKKILGIKSSVKVKTENSALDDEFKIQFAKIFEGAGTALEEASKAFGVDFDASKLMIDATKLSLKGLEGDALTKEIESFFSSTLDKWAGSLVDGLTQFQEVGEGAFETMVRLASQTNIFTNYAEELLPKFNLVGMAAIEATQAVAELSGGFDRLNTNMASYYQNFFSETEKTEAGLANISEALASVGIAMPKTREEFRSLVEGLDITSEAQQAQYAALMDVNQAFAQFVPAAKDAATATTELVNTFDAIAEQQKSLSDKLFEITATDAEKRKRELDSLLSDENRAIQSQINAVNDLNAAKEAQAGIDSEAYALETQKLTLMGNTAALRERELALINPANQAKQKEIWAIEDSKAAAEAAAQAQQQLADAQAQAHDEMAQAARDAAEEQKRLAQGVHDSISSALKSLMGESETLNAMSQSQARMTLQGALMTAKSGGSLVGYAGLEDALGTIQKGGNYGSALESRLALGRNIGLLSELSKYTKVDGSHANGLESVPYDGYIARLHKGERVQTANEAGNNSDLAAKVDRLIEVINSGNIAIAQNTAKGAKLLEKWDNDGQPETRSVA